MTPKSVKFGDEDMFKIKEQQVLVTDQSDDGKKDA